MVPFSALCRSIYRVDTKRCLSPVLCFIPFSLLSSWANSAHASLLPVREEEANKAENLTWKHHEELFPACFAGGREGAVCTPHKEEKLGAPQTVS